CIIELFSAARLILYRHVTAGSKVRMEAAMKPVVCLKCGCSDIRRSKRHGLLEWILKRFFIVPWRCMFCYNRFFRPHFRLFTRQEIPKLSRMWVTFRTVEVFLSVYDPVLRYSAWIATLHGAGRPESLGSPQNNSECRPVFGKMQQRYGAEPT